MAPGLIVKWNLGPVQPPQEEIIILSISLGTISRQLCLLGNTVKMGQLAFNLLTGNSDVGLLALLGSSGAPGDALAPVLVQTEDLLHLLPGDVNCHLHDRQRCKANTGRAVTPWRARVHLSCDGRPGKKRRKNTVSKKESEGGEINHQLHFKCTLNLTGQVIWKRLARGNKRRLVII